MASRLYDVVALGLTAYARSAFRVRLLGERFELDPGGVVVSSHRSDADVPVLISVLYREAHGPLRLRGRELHFAVRDDLFLRGFFGGYPPGLPRWARRLLFPVGIGRVLERRLPCHPLRSASRMRVAELLADEPGARMDELLPDTVVRAFQAQGLRPAAAAGDALRARYAELLWRVVGDDETCPAAAEAWRRRAAAALADFRALCELVGGGETLLVFPEGRPSPDGALGPLQPGVAALVRRARPATLRPLSLAYDPLVAGRRPLAYVGVGAPGTPAADDDAVLALLRRTTPLTAGQLVATGGGDVEVERALAEGRPVPPELRDPAARRRRLAEARAAAAGRDLRRLALESRSAAA